MGSKQRTPPQDVGAWGAGGTTAGFSKAVWRSRFTTWSGAQQLGQQPPAQTSFMVTPKAFGQVICGHCSPSALPPKSAPQPSAEVTDSIGQGMTVVEP
mmetsp:Transcript_51279/g.89483  ORF Transcript_51279/g.89483 Transcript_51279/m.89483 type:complete len:98 (-) Transcript_51279:95-388(-)